MPNWAWRKQNLTNDWLLFNSTMRWAVGGSSREVRDHSGVPVKSRHYELAIAASYGTFAVRVLLSPLSVSTSQNKACRKMQALTVVPHTLTVEAVEFQRRTVSSVSTGCSVLLLTCWCGKMRPTIFQKPASVLGVLLNLLLLALILSWAASSCGDNRFVGCVGMLSLEAALVG